MRIKRVPARIRKVKKGKEKEKAGVDKRGKGKGIKKGIRREKKKGEKKKEGGAFS